MNKEPAISHGWPWLFFVLCVSIASSEQRQAMAKPSLLHPDEKHASDGQAVADRKQTLLAMLLTRLPVSVSIDLL